jgi:nucleotide-binding universal stress UspA family protein
MIRSILLVLADAPHDAGARNYAFWLARKEGSRVHALSVVDIGAFEVPVIGSADGFMPSVVAPPIKETQSLISDLTALAQERLSRFAGLSASRGVSSSVEVKTGIPEDVISRTAVAHDIVVLSRSGYSRVPGPEDSVDAWVPPVIRRSVRPVLVAGPAFREDGDIRNILVAYDGSPHAARALLVAAELAARPGVDCTLIHVSPSEETAQGVLEPAESFLSHHGVSPRKRAIVSSKPAEVICGLATSAGVDLVIMGAYGHSPIREVLFGSTTERVLSHCDANVILQS